MANSNQQCYKLSFAYTGLCEPESQNGSWEISNNAGCTTSHSDECGKTLIDRPANQSFRCFVHIISCPYECAETPIRNGLCNINLYQQTCSTSSNLSQTTSYKCSPDSLPVRDVQRTKLLSHTHTHEHSQSRTKAQIPLSLAGTSDKTGEENRGAPQLSWFTTPWTIVISPIDSSCWSYFNKLGCSKRGPHLASSQS